MAYQPIEDYGIIGNMRTVALVGMNGSIDWFCFPHFDSPSVFGALLDDAKGGRFRITPQPGIEVTRKQFYWSETNILVTRFLSADGVGELHDFMPAGMGTGSAWHDQLVRRIKVVRGSMAFRLECRPAFDYARHPHDTRRTPHGIGFYSPDLCLGLASSLPLEVDRRRSRLRLRAPPGRDGHLRAAGHHGNPGLRRLSVRGVGRGAL